MNKPPNWWELLLFVMILTAWLSLDGDQRRFAVLEKRVAVLEARK